MPLTLVQVAFKLCRRPEPRAAKGAAEIGWGGKSQRIRDRLDAHVAREQLFGVFKAAICNVGADRATAAYAETARQLPHGQLAQRRKLRECRRLADLLQPLVDQS